MIFVTVGTHEQPFDRLIKKIDELKKEIKDTANAIPVLPEVVTVKDLKKNIRTRLSRICKKNSGTNA